MMINTLRARLITLVYTIILGISLLAELVGVISVGELVLLFGAASCSHGGEAVVPALKVTFETVGGLYFRVLVVVTGLSC
jgi:hypothetical protein